MKKLLLILLISTVVLSSGCSDNIDIINAESSRESDKISITLKESQDMKFKYKKEGYLSLKTKYKDKIKRNYKDSFFYDGNLYCFVSADDFEKYSLSVLDDDFDRRIVGTHNGMDYYYFLNSIETERDSMGRESWLCIKMNDDVWLKIFIFYEDIDDMSFIDDIFDFIDSCSIKILS